MTGRPTHGMVLAAGLGRRMRPITDTLPKPLVPLAGKTLLDRALDQLQAVNVSAATVNLHYLSHMIEDHLAARSEPQVTFSRETELLLETGGGVAAALTDAWTQSFLCRECGYRLGGWIASGPKSIGRILAR